jgi:hypothetical protein
LPFWEVLPLEFPMHAHSTIVSLQREGGSATWHIQALSNNFDDVKGWVATDLARHFSKHQLDMLKRVLSQLCPMCESLAGCKANRHSDPLGLQNHV